MKVYSQEELQKIWTYYAQVGEVLKDRSYFIQDTFPKLFNEEGALPLNDALEILESEIQKEFSVEIKEVNFDDAEEEEMLYLRYLQREYLKPQRGRPLPFKSMAILITVGILCYLSLRA